jgi:hypothetical protein
MNPIGVTQQRLLDVSGMAGRLEEARRALVDGNVPVPPDIIGRWLDYIAGDLEHDPCTLCGLRQLDHCGWACSRRCPE